MKKEYSILPRTAQNFWPTFCILILLGLVIVLVLPFFDWFTTQTQPFSISSILNYLQYSLSHFPVSDQQARSLKFILLYLGIFILFQTLKPFFKLTISPEKIYYSFLKIPLGTLIKQKDVEYCQLTILHITQSKWVSLLQRPIFGKVQTENEARLYFFPLKNLQLNLNIAHLSETEKTQMTQQLKQYYNFQDDIATLSLSQQDVQALMQNQMNINISPRTAWLLIASVPIGALGFYLNAQADFFYLSNYPVLLCFPVIFLLIFIPGYLWVKQDIEQMAFSASLISCLILAFSLTFFLLPILHSYYAFNFGTHKMVEAQLLAVDADGQKWQLDEDKQIFYIMPKTPFYNAQFEVNKTYQFPVYYHWHNYHFQHSELNQVRLKAEPDQKQ